MVVRARRSDVRSNGQLTPRGRVAPRDRAPERPSCPFERTARPSTDPGVGLHAPARPVEDRRVHPVDALRRCGGVATTRSLLRLTTARRLRVALARGEVLRVAHGRWALPAADDGLRAAASLAGAASHTSAALLHGWNVAHPPERPSVVVPRNRNVTPHRRRGVELRWRAVTAEELAHHLTDMHRTVIDCARDLPFADALAVADSALRRRDVDRARLVGLAEAVPTTGRHAALRVIECADPRAANPFESVLRAIALGVPGLAVEPQALIDQRGFYGRPDLVDRAARIVIEADSFSHHGTRTGFKRDCERYNALTIRGWIVLRFAWEHVMFHPDYVHDTILWALTRPDERAPLPPTLLWAP